MLARLREDARWRGSRTEYYGPVLVDFESLPGAAERACFKRIGTALALPEDEVDALREVGRRQLAASPEFRRFLRNFRGEAKPLPALPAAARFCPERTPRASAATGD